MLNPKSLLTKKEKKMVFSKMLRFTKKTKNILIFFVLFNCLLLQNLHPATLDKKIFQVNGPLSVSYSFSEEGISLNKLPIKNKGNITMAFTPSDEMTKVLITGNINYLDPKTNADKNDKFTSIFNINSDNYMKIIEEVTKKFGGINTDYSEAKLRTKMSFFVPLYFGPTGNIYMVATKVMLENDIQVGQTYTTALFSHLPIKVTKSSKIKGFNAYKFEWDLSGIKQSITISPDFPFPFEYLAQGSLGNTPIKQSIILTKIKSE